MSMQCPSCGCIQQQGLLCSDCCTAVETMLAAVPELIDQLQVAIGKQAKLSTQNGASGKGSVHERAPINFGALAVRDALLVELALWGDDILAIRKHPQAADIVTGIGRVVKDAYRAIDRRQERQYLGKCMYSEDGATCHAELWARPGASMARCTQCDYEHNVADRRIDLLEMAADLLVSVKEASSYLGSYGNLLVTESTIRSYLSKGQIVYHGKLNGVGIIRLGDLLTLVAANAARTSGRQLRRVS